MQSHKNEHASVEPIAITTQENIKKCQDLVFQERQVTML